MTGARSAKVAGGLNCLNHLDFEDPGFQDTERCTASHGTPGNSWESLPIPMHLDLWPVEPVVHRACLWWGGTSQGEFHGKGGLCAKRCWRRILADASQETSIIPRALRGFHGGREGHAEALCEVLCRPNLCAGARCKLHTVRVAARSAATFQFLSPAARGARW